jgi:DedD protein
MEIDDTLKNRLAGAAVVTVLAVIFLPMLFDDPVEKKGQIVSELDIPRKPEVSPLLTTAIVPEKTSEATETKPAEENLNSDTEKSDTSLNAEELAVDSEDESQKEEAKATAKPAHKKATADTVSLDDSVEKAKSSKSEESEDVSPAIAEESPKKKVSKDEAADEEKHDKTKEAKKAHSLEDEDKKVEESKVAEKKTEKSKSQLPSLDDNALDKADSHAAPATDKHRWIIQVASLSDKAKAEAFRDKLRTQGFPATVDSAWLNGKGRVYRLKVGPELDAERAQSMKNKINQLNGVHSIAIPE